jgi:phosphatidate cytidylyltransferase
MNAILLQTVSTIEWVWLIPSIPNYHLIGISIVVSTVTYLGDFAESFLKRAAAIATTGNYMPGHGGMLDRVDVLFGAPMVYYYCYFFL